MKKLLIICAFVCALAGLSVINIWSGKNRQYGPPIMFSIGAHPDGELWWAPFRAADPPTGTTYYVNFPSHILGTGFLVFAGLCGAFALWPEGRGQS